MPMRQIKFSGEMKRAAETQPKLGVRSGSTRSMYAPHTGAKERARQEREAKHLADLVAYRDAKPALTEGERRQIAAS